MKEFINDEDVAFFRANGYLKVAGVLAADELKKLADLQAQGVLSDQEFEDQKAKLLGVDGEDVAPVNAEEEPAIESTDTDESHASPFQRWGFALIALCFVVGIMVGRHWTSAEAVASDPATDWLADRGTRF